MHHRMGTRVPCVIIVVLIVVMKVYICITAPDIELDEENVTVVYRLPLYIVTVVYSQLSASCWL